MSAFLGFFCSNVMIFLLIFNSLNTNEFAFGFAMIFFFHSYFLCDSRLKSPLAVSSPFPLTNPQSTTITVVMATISIIIAMASLLSNSHRVEEPLHPLQLQQLITKHRGALQFKRKPRKNPCPTLAVPREAIEGWSQPRTFLSVQSPN